MKAAVILLVLGAFLIHADALQCLTADCKNVETCTYGIETCDSGVVHCMFMMMNYPIFMLLQGCTTESFCLQMKNWVSSTRCCKSDLCN
ncbi:hypothetical protein FKM82_023939 [Ascaphus truei]